MYNVKEIQNISLARDVAMTAHMGQEYDPGESYFEHHITKVVDVITSVNVPSLHRANLIQIAYLHDIIEDTQFTLLNLSKIFSPIVVSGVDLCTDGIGDSRKERKEAFYKKYNAVNYANYAYDFYYGATVKTADRIVNMRKSISSNSRHLGKYISEHEKFRNVVVRHADKLMRNAYDDIFKDTQ